MNIDQWGKQHSVATGANTKTEATAIPRAVIADGSAVEIRDRIVADHEASANWRDWQKLVEAEQANTAEAMRQLATIAGLPSVRQTREWREWNNRVMYRDESGTQHYADAEMLNSLESALSLAVADAERLVEVITYLYCTAVIPKQGTS